MRRATIKITFDVDDHITRDQVHSIAGDAYAQVEDAVLHNSDGSETRVSTHNVEMEVGLRWA